MSNKKTKEPLIKVSKNMDVKFAKKMALNLGAVVVAIILSGLFLIALGYDPVEFYSEVFRGSFSNTVYIKLFIWSFVPLLIVSLGLTLAFKMRFWNIGAEGQFLIGAALSMTVALLIGDTLASPLGLIIVLISGAIGGGLFALIPAIFKIRFGTNETLLTLMFNYIGLYVVDYFLNVDFYSISGSFPTYKKIDSSLWLSTINIGSLSIDTSIIVAMVLLIFVAVYFKYTKQGYEINVVGDSPNTARYAGMKVKWITLRTMFLSGAVIGLGAALVLTGSSASHSISTGMTGGVGWTAIIVSWLAKLNPYGIAVVAFLLTILDRGSEVAKETMGINTAVSEVTQGIVLFSVLAFDFFINYKVSFRKKSAAVVEADSLSEDSDNSNASIIKTEEITASSDEVDTSTVNSDESGEQIVSTQKESIVVKKEKVKIDYCARLQSDKELSNYCDKHKFKIYKKSGGDR